MLIDDAPETKSEKTKYIIYDMDNRKEVKEALEVEFIEKNETHRIINQALHKSEKLIRVGQTKTDE